MVSRKVIDSEAVKITGKTYADLDDAQKRYVLTCIVGDDWGSVLKTVAPPVLGYLW